MKIYLASGNAHKVHEFQAIADATKAAGGAAVEFVSAKAVGGMPAVVEDAGTFVGNARKKARALAVKLRDRAAESSTEPVWVLADDSGICVDALDGAPGVESAYFAGPQGDPAANMKKLVEAMREVPEGKRSAYFVCVLVLLEPGGVEQQVEERVYGTLLHQPRGGAGFGYDPLFVPAGEERSYAELSDFEKNLISHRARAAKRLITWLNAQRHTRGNAC